MLKEKFKYKVKFVKHPQDKYTTFNVGVKIKDSTEYMNYRIFVFSVVNVQDGDEISFTKFISVEGKKYNGEVQINVSAEIEIVGGELPKNVVDTEPVLNISSDDLPF